MPDDDTTSWTVSVSRETDTSVRLFLAQRGPEERDLSKFIEDAVKWRVLDQTITEARAGFTDLAPGHVEKLADDALAATRRDRGTAASKA